MLILQNIHSMCSIEVDLCGQICHHGGEHIVPIKDFEQLKKHSASSVVVLCKVNISSCWVQSPITDCAWPQFKRIIFISLN